MFEQFYLRPDLERFFGRPPSFPFSLAAFAFAFDFAKPPSFPSCRAISLTFIAAA
jgi:hypothetical protein